MFLYTRAFHFPSFHTCRLLSVLAILLVSLAACGGGDAPDPAGSDTSSRAPTSAASQPSSGSTPTSADRSAATAAFATPVPGATGTAPAQTSAPAIGTPEPEGTPVPAPDAAPAMLRPAPVTMPDCGDSLRRMLAAYDDPRPFTVDVVNRLNDEFVAQRPDCVALGWGPEFSQDPVVCLTEDDLPGGPSRQVGGTGTFELLPTNMFYREHFLPDGSESEMVHIFLHLNLVPLRDEVPEHGSLLGSAFGGCWYYKGVGQSSFWYMSFIGFVPGQDRLGNMTARGRSKAVGESVFQTHSPSATFCCRMLCPVGSTPARPWTLPASFRRWKRPGSRVVPGVRRIFIPGAAGCRPLWMARPVDVQDLPRRVCSLTKHSS